MSDRRRPVRSPPCIHGGESSWRHRAPCWRQDAPKILLDQPLRAVEYQLNRLTHEELVLVERKDDDVRYRPVYVALLTRKGVPPQFRDEAVAALARWTRVRESRVLLDALAKVPTDDPVTTGKVASPASEPARRLLRKDRETFIEAIDDASGKPLVLRGAYAALMAADGKPDDAWKLAENTRDRLSTSLDPFDIRTSARSLRAQLFTPISALLTTSPDAATRAAALEALAGRDMMPPPSNYWRGK